eukprot:13781092-Alexandrium_andersonii.AAC.1
MLRSRAWPSAPQPSRAALPSQPTSSKLPLMYSRVSSATCHAHGFVLCRRTASSPVAILRVHRAAPPAP